MHMELFYTCLEIWRHLEILKVNPSDDRVESLINGQIPRGHNIFLKIPIEQFPNFSHGSKSIVIP